jgi:hypothetical protein
MPICPVCREIRNRYINGPEMETTETKECASTIPTCFFTAHKISR